MSGDAVRAQYEAYPYPARDPGDEARRLIAGSPSHLAELDHYCFGGRRSSRRPFRALVAGGGTGDATVMLAQHLADAAGEEEGGAPAEVHYLDISEAASDMARRRVAARGLANVVFHRLSILDLAGAGLAPFDYIDCCGVLHHLEDPAAGLAALGAVLAEDGGMGLMFYGALGRTGVYDAQAMLRMLDAEDPPARRLETARRLLRQLPPTNRLRRNPFLGDHLEGGDAGLFDLLLHARDAAYRVPEVLALAEGASLRVVALVEPARYDPASYLNDPKLTARLGELTWAGRAAFAELLAGNMRKHVLYVVKEGNPVTPPPVDDLAAVPVLRDFDGATLAGELRPGAALGATVDGVALRFAMPPLAGAMVARMDGRRTLGDIFDDLRTLDRNLDEAAFARQFATLHAGLNGLGRLFLRYPPAGRDG